MPKVPASKSLHWPDFLGETPAAPVIASFSSDIDSGINGGTLTLVGSAEAGGAVRIFDGRVLLGSATADASGAWQFRTGNLLDGAHAFTSTVTNAAGKTSAASATFGVMLAAQAMAAPTIASSLPDTGTTMLVISDTADHVINATESTTVEFNVSGLDAGATGTVTFTDAANHLVAVNVGANGSYLADLSTLTDGTITSSLSATGPSGNTTSATGNVVTLDTDRGLTPAVSINALDPAHVTFTISGLEGDESGTMTFTDINDKQVVVDVGSNGDYSANLSSLAQAEVTYLVSVKDPVGNAISFDPPFGLGDGSATAAAGTPQVPNLLSGYAVRPPWQVAGVDYAVGINAGTVLENPSTMNMAGVSVNSTNHVVQVTGDNIVLDGWNFNGWTVSVSSGAENATITNNSFASGGFLRFEPGSVGATIMYNKFDQTGEFDNLAPCIVFASGTLVVEYNYFLNSFAMHAQFPILANDVNLTFQYNLLSNAGLGAFTPQAAHGDFIQIFGSNAGVVTANINYNTVVQNLPNGQAASQGWSLNSSVGPTLFQDISISNNTEIIAPNANVNYVNLLAVNAIYGTATIANNYAQMGPSFTQFLLLNTNIPGPHTGTVVTSNDINMVNGTYIYPPTGGTGPISSTLITSISTDSNVVGDLITNDNTLTLTGTAPANSTVKVFDGTTQIGTTTANANGAWSYNTATLADGSHSLTISATSSGTTTTSAPRTVTVDTNTPGTPTITSFSPDTGTVGDGSTTANTLTLTGTAEANSTVKVFDGTTQIGTANANGSGAWSFATDTLSNATHAFTVKAMDAAGNTSAASTALNVTVNAPPNLVTNGGFETGNFSGWTLGGNYGAISFGPQTSVDGNAESGQYAANIGAMGSDATLSQAIQTTAGQHYTLTFWLANLGGGPNDFAIKWNGSTLLSLVNAPAQGYKQYTFDVVGTASTSQLLISARQDPSHWSLDAISVAPAGTQMPATPSIDSYSTDTGALGDGVTNDNTLALTGTAPANSTVKVFDGTTQLGTVAANGSGAWTYTTAALANGTHSLTATATSSGTTSAASAVLAVTIDTTAPSAPTIASFSGDSGTVGDGITNDSTLTLTGTAAANSTVKVFDGATLLGSAVANGSGAWSYTTAALANGAHNLTATSTDAAGNTSVASAVLAATVDTVAPTAPVIAGDTISGTDQVTLTGTAEANSTIKVFEGTAQLGTASANSSGAWTFTTAPLAAGKHDFTATATDAAGNTSALSDPLDPVIGPAAPIISSFSTDSGVAGDGITNDNTLTLTGTSAANSTVKVFDGATLLGSAVANGSGAWSYTTAALPNGAHNLTATSTDAAGNTSAASAALSVTIDTTAPTAPTIASFSTDSGVAGDGITNDNTLTLTGTSAANSTVKVFDGATLLGSAVANGSGAWSYTTAALPNGAHNLTATSTDAAGNTSAASAALSVTIDTTAPTAPTIASFSTDSGVAGDGITNDNTLTLTGTSAANSTVKVFDGATLLGSAVANGSGAWSYTTAALPNGAHNLTATSTDAAGNTSAASAALSVTIDTTAPTAPTIASFSTDSGVAGDGITNDNTLTLTGTSAANSTVKVFDGATLLGSAVANGSGAWSYTTAALPNGAHNLTATSTDAAGNTSAASAVLAATVDTVAPTAPVIAGDTISGTDQVTLTGTAEANSTIKVFEGTAQLGTASANSSGAWTFTTAPLAAGKHDFTATATDVAGNTSALSEPLDPVIGAIESNGATSLTAMANHYYLFDSTGSGPSLKMSGMDYVAGQFGAWTPIGAEKTASGYEVAWKYGSSDNYTIWNVDSQGNYLAHVLDFVSGSKSALQSFETSFVQDVNGDGQIGIVKTVVESDGATSLTATADHYYLFDSTGSGPSLKMSGMDYVAGQFGAWTPIGAEKTASGYEVAWKYGSSDNYTIWNVDSQGNYLAHVLDFVPGSNSALQSFETSFVQDVNGDGRIGTSNIVNGTSGNNTLTSSSANEVFFGHGGNDTFVFTGTTGKDIVADFQQNNDVLQLSHNAFANFAAVLANATQVGSDVTITIDASNSVTLHNTTLSQLTNNNIHIV